MTDARRVAVVTGGAKRVGRAIVERLAAKNCDVLFTYLSSHREATELQDAVHQAHGITAVGIRADLADPTAAAAAVSRALDDRFGRLDILVNNASLWLPGRLADTTLEMTQKVWSVHVESPLLLCKTFADQLRGQRGHIINMVDLLAERPWPQYLAYCASKAALGNLTLGLARELAPEVTVNGIAPGVVEWPDDYPPAEREKYLRRVPLDRPGTPEDVAGLVAYLVTQGSYITGQIIRLDGGRSVT